MPAFVTRAAFALATLATPLPAAEAPTSPPSLPLAESPLAPALAAAAAREGIRLFHLDPAGSDARVGDAAVAWIGASDGKTTRQWLIQFRRAPTDSSSNKPAQPHPTTKFLSWGPVVTFKPDLETLDLWIAGPVVIKPAPAKAPATVPVTRTRISVPVDLLRLGLDNAIRVSQHIGRRSEVLSKKGTPLDLAALYAVDSPVAPENTAAPRIAAEQIGFSPETERVWVGGYLALQTFYTVITSSRPLAAIAETAIQKPRLVGLSNALKGTQFKASFGGPAIVALDPAERGMLPVSTEALEAPFTFFFGESLITGGSFVASHAAPPLDTVGGILSILAWHPKNPRRVVQLAIISSIRGPLPP